jgi:hypothetical protein
MTSQEVRNYLLECEDLQIFYINKHILIYELMMKLIDLLKYNKTMCDQINKLTSPNIFINRKDDSVNVEIKSLIGDIKKINEYDTSTIGLANAMLKSDSSSVIQPIDIPTGSSSSGTTTPLTQFLTLEKVADTDQWFNGTKKLEDFGKNVYLNERKEEVSIDILVTELQTKQTFFIKFGENLANFKDYMVENTIARLEFTLTTTSGTSIKYKGNAEIDYLNEHIKFTLNSKLPTTMTADIFKTMSITILNLNRYKISIRDQDIFKNISGNKIIYYVIYNTDGTIKDQLLMSYKEDGTISYFENLNIADPTTVATPQNRYKHITDICARCVQSVLETKGTFNTVRYYINSLVSFNILQYIKEIQDDNNASLMSILGSNPTGGEYKIEKMIANYRKNIQNGVVPNFFTVPDSPTITKADPSSGSPEWTDFKPTNASISQYFKTKLSTITNVDTIKDKDHLQQVIYRCYDLQVLYMIKHLEVIYINNILFYYMDMLAKQVAVLLFILSLYKRYNFDINEIGENRLKDAFTDIGKLVIDQSKVIRGMSGGANEPVEGKVVTNLVENVGTNVGNVVENVGNVDPNVENVVPISEENVLENVGNVVENVGNVVENIENVGENVDPTVVVNNPLDSEEPILIPSIQSENKNNNTPDIQTKTSDEISEYINTHYSEEKIKIIQDKITETIKEYNSLFTDENNTNKIDDTNTYNTVEDVNTFYQKIKILIDNYNTSITTNSPQNNVNNSTGNVVLGGGGPQQNLNLLKKLYSHLATLYIAYKAKKIENKTYANPADKANDLQKLMYDIQMTDNIRKKNRKGDNAFEQYGLSSVLFHAEDDMKTYFDTKTINTSKGANVIETTKVVNKNIDELQTKLKAKNILLDPGTIFQNITNYQKSKIIEEEVKQQLTRCKDTTTLNKCDPAKIRDLETKQTKVTQLLNKSAKKVIQTILVKIPKLNLNKEVYTQIESDTRNDNTYTEIADLLSNNENLELFMTEKITDDIQLQKLMALKEQLNEARTRLTTMSGGAGGTPPVVAAVTPPTNTGIVLVSKMVELCEARIAAYNAEINKNKDLQEVKKTKLKTVLMNLKSTLENPSLSLSDKNTHLTKINEYVTFLNTEPYNDIKYKEIDTFIQTVLLEVKEAEKEAAEEAERKKIAERQAAEAEKADKMKIIETFKSTIENPTIKLFLDNIDDITNSLKNPSKKNKIIQLLVSTGIIVDEPKIKEIKEINMFFTTITEDTINSTAKDDLIIKQTKFNELIEQYKGINQELISKIKEINLSLSIIDIEIIAEYNDLIKQLANCWNTIKPQEGELEPVRDKDVLERIQTTAESPNFDIKANQLIAAFKKSFELFTEINNLKKSNVPITQEIFLDYKKKIAENFNGINLTPDQISKLTKNIRVIFEDILGAAMVILRIKPLIPHNTAPTYKEIKEYIDKNPEFVKKLKATATITHKDLFTVREYLKLKSREITETKQQGGYKYGDIININDDTGKIQIGDYCNCITPTTKEYGPFAGIYTPEYNNFDIYAYLFGTEKLGDPESKNFKPPSDLTIDNYGSLPYTNNTSQKLMSKLTKGGNVVLFGYGFSGSGKTYALIEGGKGAIQYDPSLLEQFMKDNSELIHSIDFLDIYPLGIENTTDKTKRIRIFCGTDVNDELQKLYGPGNYEADELYNSIQNPQSFQDIDKRIKQLEVFRRQNLRICATPNNDSSSRSFLQITVNLKASKVDTTIKNKIIFFDMPGTENTVRIRTEFLGVKTFENVSKLYPDVTTTKNFNRPDEVDTAISKAFIIYGSGPIEIFIPNNYKLFQAAKNITITDTTLSEYNTVFKNVICTIEKLRSTFKLDNLTVLYISNIAQSITLFLNGFTAKKLFDLREQDFKEKKKIKLIDKDTVKQICINFIKNVILREKEWKIGEKKNQGVYKYFTLSKTKPNEIKSLVTNIDSKNIARIFDIYFPEDIPTNDKTNKITLQNSKILTDQIELHDFTLLIKDTMPTKDNTKVYYIANDLDHPLIRYFIAFMNIVINKKVNKIDGGIDDGNFYGILIILIYKYVDFIVQQGSAIVTNLEHLKFFFLSNTNNVSKYNNNKTDDKEKYLCESESKCLDLITNKREYHKSTKIGMTGIEINETINMGNMEDFRLLSILQNLANQQHILTNLSPKPYTYTITEATKTQSAITKEEYTLDLFSNPPPSTGKAKSSFIMFTNIKIFRDDSNKADGTDKNSLIKRITLKTDSTVEDTSSTNPEQNTKLKDNLNLLCPAEYDTLEFAQSISSTTQTENNDFGDKEALIKAKCDAEAPPILKTAAAKPSSGPTKTAPVEQAAAAPSSGPGAASTAPEGKVVASRPKAALTSQALGPKPAGRASVTSAAASQLSRHGVPAGQVLRQAGTGTGTTGTKKGGSLTSNSKHSPKKFNMKELTKKHKKQNRISTIKKQLKTNNKKTLFSRRSKKYQE